MSAALIGAAAIGGLASLAGNLMTNSSNANLNATNRNWQSSESEKARVWQAQQNKRAMDWQERMWNAENEYNTPAHQRELMQQAGYNPWISGSGSPSSVAGSAGAGSSGGASMSGAPSSIPMQNPFAGIGQMVSNLPLQQANIANQNAQTIKQASDAYTAYLKATGDYSGGQRILKSLLRGVSGSDNLMSDITDGINQEYLASKIQNDRNALQYEIEAQYGKAKASQELKNIQKQEDFIDEQTNNLRKLQNVSDVQISKMAEETSKIIQERLTIEKSREFIVKKLQYESEILAADPMRSDLFSGVSKGAKPVLDFLKLLLKFLGK